MLGIGGWRGHAAEDGAAEHGAEAAPDVLVAGEHEAGHQHQVEAAQRVLHHQEPEAVLHVQLRDDEVQRVGAEEHGGQGEDEGEAGGVAGGAGAGAGRSGGGAAVTRPQQRCQHQQQTGSWHGITVTQQRPLILR